jgi:acetyl-CoA acetyltransferase
MFLGNCKPLLCIWFRNDWYGYSQIQSGMAHCIIAGGAESMSFIPMGGYKPTRIMLLQKQETKITTGNGFNRSSSTTI